MPAIHAIRERHAGSVLVLLTDRHPGRGFVSSWDVLGETGWIDEVEFYTPETGVRGKWKNAWQLFKRLRKRSLTHAYLLTSGRTPWQRWRDWLFFRIVVGTRYCHDAGALPAAPRAADGSLVRMEPEWRRLLRAIPAADPAGFSLPVPPAAQHEAEEVLAGFVATGSGLMVGIAPGSKMPSKIWPAERYLELGSRLLAEYRDLRLVILGGAEDVAVGDGLCAAWGPRSRNLAGSVSVMAAAAVLKRCAAFVGNDTGTMHLAAMAGVPCVALFSARDNPGKWDPYGKGHAVLRRDVGCAGCMLEVCSEHGNKCLRLITVDEVLRATQDTVGNGN